MITEDKLKLRNVFDGIKKQFPIFKNKINGKSLVYFRLCG